MADSSIFPRHQATVGTSSAVEIVFPTGVQRIYVTTITQDVFIEFNGAANTDSFRIVASSFPTEFNFSGSSVNNVSLLGAENSANVYVLGVVS